MWWFLSYRRLKSSGTGSEFGFSRPPLTDGTRGRYDTETPSERLDWDSGLTWSNPRVESLDRGNIVLIGPSLRRVRCTPMSLGVSRSESVSVVVVFSFHSILVCRKEFRYFFDFSIPSVDRILDSSLFAYIPFLSCIYKIMRLVYVDLWIYFFIDLINYLATSV